MIENLFLWLEALPPLSLYATLAVLAATENVFPPVPADTAVALGAFLASQGALSVTTVFAVTWSANVITATAMYVAGRVIGRPIFESRIGQRLVPPNVLRAVEREYHRHGMWGIFLARLLPMWRAVVPPFAGVVRLSAWRTLPPLYLAGLLWYSVLTFVVYRLAGTLEGAIRFVDNLNRGLAVAAALLLAVVVWAIIRAVRRRRTHGE